MADMTPIERSFQDIIARAEGTVASDVATRADALLATEITTTILPRMLTLGVGDDARLSVIVRNRRVISIEDVEPSELWQGNATPKEAVCDAGDEDFTRAFAEMTIALSERGTARIDTALVDGALPGSSLAGYPVARLADDIAAIRQAAKGDMLEKFLGDWSGHARAWSEDEPQVELPDGASIDEAWMLERLAEWSAVCDALDEDTHLRFIIRGGDTPMALACASMNGKCGMVVCAMPEEFSRLETALAVLRGQYGRA